MNLWSPFRERFQHNNKDRNKIAKIDRKKKVSMIVERVGGRAVDVIGINLFCLQFRSVHKGRYSVA